MKNNDGEAAFILKGGYVGGPAFPRAIPGWEDDQGMTLRDWFAGMALQYILSNTYFGPDGASENAYDIADAMLKERSKND